MQDLSCEQLRATIARGGGLTAVEWAHVEVCEACLDAWVCYELESKPEVRIPADFAARVAMELPQERGGAEELRGREDTEALTHGRQWGLITAIALVAVGLMGMPFADPGALSTRMGLVFLGIAASEIAGISLWLGTRGPGERQS